MESKEMMLHFDLSLGCTGESLVGALADLCGNVDCVKQGLEDCGISGEEVQIRREARKSSKVTSLELPSFTHRPFQDPPQPKRGAKRKPAWARSPKSMATPDEDLKEPKESQRPLGQWLKDESVTLNEVKKRIAHSRMQPIPQALALKTIDILISSREKSTGLSADSSALVGSEATKVLCEIVAFCELIAALNLASITATRVAMSNSPDLSGGLQSWILTLAEDIPTFDRSWPAPYSDQVGLALIKTVTTRFGARGESVIERHGVGGDTKVVQPLATTRALLCHPSAISSRADTSGMPTETMPSVEITATLGPGIDLSDLLRRLSGFGMKSVSTWQTFQGSTFPRVMLRGLAPYGEVQTAIEALLITGEAAELSTHHVETQSLQHRTVSVPFGRGQKMQACRVIEWLWCGKILRADPDPSDLSLLVQATGFAQDVVRADVLAAWRKWRQAS